MKKSTHARWLAATNPIADYCARTPGAKQAIIARLNQIAPQPSGPWVRQQVSAYLHPDPKKRMEPRTGIWLALAEAAKDVMNDKIQP